jgi:DNA polymerase-3 subunit gamma/tau
MINFTYKSEYMSLANKYRPKSFQDVIGQSHIIDILQAKIAKHNNNSHNYIFYGPRGTGKTSTARLFAKAINAISVDKNGNPSQNDPNVIAIDTGTTLDYVEIDAASHTGVDNIREEILAKVPYPPTMLKKKVYVIDEVHMLSTGAFNALLKTIEEPKDYVVFILATTEIHKVPDTIISRCQVFNFKKVSESEIINHLAHIAEQEHIPYEREAL